MQDGVLVITAGPCADLSLRTYRVQYQNDARFQFPYLGLENLRESNDSQGTCFLDQRKNLMWSNDQIFIYRVMYIRRENDLWSESRK